MSLKIHIEREGFLILWIYIQNPLHASVLTFNLLKVIHLVFPLVQVTLKHLLFWLQTAFQSKSHNLGSIHCHVLSHGTVCQIFFLDNFNQIICGLVRSSYYFQFPISFELSVLFLLILILFSQKESKKFNPERSTSEDFSQRIGQL